MKFLTGTPRILLIYVVCMFSGQAAAVGIGLLIDPYSKTLALTVFIPLYYAMYWVAWRVALRCTSAIARLLRRPIRRAAVVTVAA